MSLLKSYLDFMLCIMEADGEITDEEKEMFLKMLSRSSVRKSIAQRYRSLLEGKRVGLDPKDVISRIVKVADAEALGWIVRDAYLAADVDGKISKKEVALINELLEAAGIPKKLHGEIKSWGIEFVKHTKCIPYLFKKT